MTRHATDKVDVCNTLLQALQVYVEEQEEQEVRTGGQVHRNMLNDDANMGVNVA